jgi:hypothetical protein
MTDGKRLLIDGFILGTITAAVVLLASALVHAHVDGRLVLDDDGQHRSYALTRLSPTSF